MPVGAEPQEPAATAAAALAEEDQAAAVVCSICIEAVHAASGERSTARLCCGHKFHLDCIGSVFNINRGVMQCPNCRNTEEGNWRHYANGSGSAHDDSMDEVQYSDFFYLRG